MTCLALGFLAASAPILYARNGSDLERRISLPQLKGTVYEILAAISRESGYLFIYGEETLENDRPAEISQGSYSIRRAVCLATGDPSLELRLIGGHVLISKPGLAAPSEPQPRPDSLFITVEGSLVDAYTGEAVQYATVGIPSSGIGAVSNLDGSFRLRAPDSLRLAPLRISHLGYAAYETSMAAFGGESLEIRLEPKVISIQEVIVRLVNPLRLLDEMRRNRELNYASKPAYLTAFYREGVERRKGVVSLAEAVFKIYKAPLGSNSLSDQVKLLKMRRISNEKERDTLLLKMKSGINSCLMLDIVRDPADFLSQAGESLYNYLQHDITEIDGRMAYVISFEQKPEVNEPLYAGRLYIDAESSALLSARFAVNPRYIEQATPMFVTRKSRNIKVKARSAEYIISYRQWNGRYYASHIRGDLHFSIRRSNRLFSSQPVHTWFEMATCRIDSDSVSRFSRGETLRTRTIFADTNYSYDAGFWNDFNIILPEDHLSEAIRRVNAKIEEEGI
jgi:hypothetical protein